MKTKWQDATLSLKQITQQLGIDKRTAFHYAANLSLPFPRPGRRTTLSADEFQGMTGKTKVRTVEQLATQREKNRNAWLASMEAHPDWLHSTRAHTLPGVFAWLNINDHEWLDEHSQRQESVQGGGGHQVSVEYWMRLDAQLAQAVLAMAQRLKEAPGRPFRITINVLAGELHEAGRLYHQLDKLPLTEKALAEVVETPEAIGIRKLWWEAERYRNARRVPNRTQLIQKATVDQLATHPRVKQTIDTILEQLKRSAIVGWREEVQEITQLG